MSSPPPLSAGMNSNAGGGSSSNEQQIRLQILASLFPPGSQHGSYIAHLKTWEDVPGAPPGSAESKKPRYVLLAVTSDGRLKLHKSKRNMNGTFSIGKTWRFEDVGSLEVHKPRRTTAGGNMAVPCFTITINGKSYLWETESARQQDDFLITIVRSYRQYQNGEQPRLIGFQVGEIPGAPPAYEVPLQSGGMATPTAASRFGGSMGAPPAPRPTTGHSVMSNGSSRYEGVPPHAMPHAPSASGLASFTDPMSHQHHQQPTGGPPPGRNARLPSTGSGLDAQDVRGNSPPMFISSFSGEQQQQQAVARGPSPAGLGLRKQSSSGNISGQPPSSSARPPLPIPQVTPAHAPAPARQVPASSSSNTLAVDRHQAPTRPHITPPDKPFTRRGSEDARLQIVKGQSAEPRTPVTATTPDESSAAAKAAALLGQNNNLEDDSDVMLTNVEEMLEGLEWGAVAHGHSADELEKRLLGELNALEAAGIHAIIESDDRVNDVVRYLDNALADLDKMDLMISLYKTHLNAVADDISHIESQNQGLQLQSSNQRALLAELDRRLKK